MLFDVLDGLQRARNDRDFVAHGRWIPIMNQERFMDLMNKPPVPVGSMVPFADLHHRFHDRAHSVGMHWKMLAGDGGPMIFTLEDLCQMTVRNSSLKWELLHMVWEKIFPFSEQLSPRRAPRA